MDQDLLILLEQIGLKAKEAQVYLALLELGQGTVKRIADLTRLKRPIIYVVLNDLKQHGYISELPDRKVNAYQATSPGVIISQKKTVIKEFTEMLPLFLTLRNKATSRPQIQYIESKAGILKIYEEMNYAEKAFFITNCERVEQTFPKLVDQWLSGFRKKRYKLQAQFVLADTAVDRHVAAELAASGQAVKILSALDNAKIDLTLFDNKLALTALGDKPFMVLIESEVVATSMAVVFEAVWQSGQVS